MKIVVSGSTGLIGSALTQVLQRRDQDVVPLVRRRVAPGEHALAWDAERGTIDRAGLEARTAFFPVRGGTGSALGPPARKGRLPGPRGRARRILSPSLPAPTPGPRHHPPP